VRAEYDSARLHLDSSLLAAGARDDSAAIARALTLIGLTWYRQGHYDSARPILEGALDLKLRLGILEELSSSYNALGLIAWNESRLTEADELFARTAEAAVAENKDRARAIVGNNRGLVLCDLGQFTEARASFEQALTAAREIGDRRLEGFVLTNLGMLAVWTGAPREAISYLRAAEAPYRESEEVYGALVALGQLGTAYAALGRSREAIVVFDSAVRLSREHEMRQQEAENLELLAQTYRTAGDCDRALDLYGQAEAINADVGLVSEVGSDRRARAEIYRQLGALEMARDFAERALETHVDAEADWEVFADHVLLADLLHELGLAQRAGSHFLEARRLAELFAVRTARIDLALAEVRIADRAHQAQRVLEVLESVGQDLAHGGYDSEWEAEYWRARALSALGDIDAAEAAGWRAVAAVERVRSAFGSSALRSRYTTTRLDAYSTLVQVLLDRGDITTAFEVADAARGRTLLEELAVTGQTLRDDSLLASFDERESVLREIDGLQAKIRETETYDPLDPDSIAIAELNARLAEARRRFERHEIESAERYGTQLTLLGQGDVSARDVQAGLRTGEVLLEYLVTDDRLLGFAMTSEGVREFTVDISQENLANRVRLVCGLLADPGSDGDGAREALGALHDLLVGPAAIGDAERVIVVPHDVLSYLSFAALLDPATGRYLIEDVDVQTLPAAAALPVLRRRASAGIQTAQVAAFSPFVNDLPATRSEVRAVQDAVAKSRVFEGRRATERRVRDALGDERVVHVATHGVMNTRSPLFSRLELAGGGPTSHDDGRLEVHEVLRLSIQSPLVFLSGCETGLGTGWSTSFARGEDYTTLARSFLYAGAQYVVSTLWRIEDEGAAAFAGQFYTHLRSSDPVQALAGAQRILLSDARFSAPYYWAGYRVAGAGAN
jgi:tetratricopeptide (TPR) repeat protein